MTRIHLLARERGHGHRTRRFIATLATTILFIGFSAVSSNAYSRPGETQRVSLSSASNQGAAAPLGNMNCARTLGPPSISANGRFVAFASNLEGLAPNETPIYSDVFV